MCLVKCVHMRVTSLCHETLSGMNPNDGLLEVGPGANKKIELQKSAETLAAYKIQ